MWVLWSAYDTDKIKMERLIQIEYDIDKLNGEYGDLCIFCHSKEYNSAVGVIHSATCVMTQIREKLKNANENRKIQ